MEGDNFTFSDQVARWKRPFGLPPGYMISAKVPITGEIYDTQNQWHPTWAKQPGGLGESGFATDAWNQTLHVQRQLKSSQSKLRTRTLSSTASSNFRSSPSLSRSTEYRRKPITKTGIISRPASSELQPRMFTPSNQTPRRYLSPKQQKTRNAEILAVRDL